MEKTARWNVLKLWQIMYLDITIPWCKFKKKIEWWENFRVTQVYTLKCGKLPVRLEHPSAYHKWHCEKHIIEEATYFGVCELAIFPRKKIKDKIGFFWGNIENRPSLKVFLMIFSLELCSDLCFWSWWLIFYTKDPSFKLYQCSS